MPFLVADLQTRESVPIKYAEKEDAKSMAKLLNEMGLGDWHVLVFPSVHPRPPDTISQ